MSLPGYEAGIADLAYRAEGELRALRPVARRGSVERQDATTFYAHDGDGPVAGWRSSEPFPADRHTICYLNRKRLGALLAAWSGECRMRDRRTSTYGYVDYFLAPECDRYGIGPATLEEVHHVRVDPRMEGEGGRTGLRLLEFPREGGEFVAGPIGLSELG